MKNNKGNNKKNSVSRHRRLKGQAHLAHRQVNISAADSINHRKNLKPGHRDGNKPNSFKGLNLLNLRKPKNKAGEKGTGPKSDLNTKKTDFSAAYMKRTAFGNGSKGLYQNNRLTNLTAAGLLLATLAAAIISTTPKARAEESPLPTPTLQLAKEYIYAGSRMLAIEDYGITPSPSPTPTPTP